jgi:hypothetical protein
MTLMKSMLLGSAAAIVAVAAAQAADLPTRKAAPVEYVKICNVGGITGWTLPGSDTCVKLSGFITAQFVGGNINTQYNYGTIANLAAVPVLPSALTTPITVGGVATTPLGVLSNDLNHTQRVLIAASTAQKNTDFYRNETGYTLRANFGFDFASNTAYGPLIGHFDLNTDMGNGLNPLQYGTNAATNITYLNEGYLTWAGITAGKAASFYSFTGGGDNYANIFSPDQKGFNQPVLFAYTASFGGGFSATIAAQSPGTNGASGGGTDQTGSYFNTNSGPNFATFNPTSIEYGGIKWPDFVGNLHVTQSWGEAQVSGVVHDVNVASTLYNGGVNEYGCGLTSTVLCNGSETKTGWGIDAGVKFILPSVWPGFWWGPGDDFLVTGSYTQSAVWYSGLPDGMWTDNGQVNGNGQVMNLADAFFNPLTNQWSTPRAWSVAALLEHHFTPQFYVDLEASVGGIEWSNMGGGCNLAIGLAACSVVQALQGPMSPHATSWIVGADLGWNPVTNLNFDLELMYQGTNQERPSGFLGTIYNYGEVNPNGTSAAYFAPGAWQGSSDGFAGRIRITRYF